MAKYLKIDLATVHPAMSAAIRKHHFYTLWKEDAPRSEFFEFVNTVRAELGLPLYSWQTFDKGWQYRTVLHAEYAVARDEVFNLIYGWW